MTAIIKDNQFIYFDNITTAEENIIWEEFSVARPGIYIDPSQRGQWDGVYRKYNRAKQRIARPLLSFLRGVCQRNDLPLVVQDEREPWPYEITDPNEINADFLPGITLEQYQIDAIRKACVAEVGIFNVATGGGKSELAAGICKAIKCPTVILADQTIVIDQLKARVELREVIEEVGVFYSGKRPNGELIVVGSIQSLTRPTKSPIPPNRRKDESDNAFAKRLVKFESTVQAFHTRRRNVKKLQEYVKNAEMLIVDEADKACSDPWKNLFKFVYNGRRRYGLSGTPYDPDKPVEAMVIQEHLGSELVRIGRKEVFEAGRIADCECIMIVVDATGNIHEGSAYDIAYDEKLVNNQKFHRLVAKLAKRNIKSPSDGILILVDRETLGVNLNNALNVEDIKNEFIFGKTPKKKRNMILKQFEQRELNALIGGKIINRGLDLTGGCEALIIAAGGKLQSELYQKIGRALRKNRDGKSYIYAFFFRNNRYLYSHSKSQLKALVRAEFPVKVVFPGGVVDGAKLVKSRFHVAKHLLVAPVKTLF